MNKFRIVIELDTYSSDPSEWVMECVSEVVGDQLEEDFEKAQQILFKDGSLEETRLKALYWAERAKSQLSALPSGEINDLMGELTSFVVSRVL